VHTVPQTEVQVEVANDGCLSVSDHGPGVPPEDRAHLFERFWRGRAAPSAGAGLGLAIVKETMQAHGGAIQVANNPGGGARFTLRFP
jgi:signal transduction histidine kinase